MVYVDKLKRFLYNGVGRTLLEERMPLEIPYRILGITDRLVNAMADHLYPALVADVSVFPFKELAAGITMIMKDYRAGATSDSILCSYGNWRCAVREMKAYCDVYLCRLNETDSPLWNLLLHVNNAYQLSYSPKKGWFYENGFQNYRSKLLISIALMVNHVDKECGEEFSRETIDCVFDMYEACKYTVNCYDTYDHVVGQGHYWRLHHYQTWAEQELLPKFKAMLRRYPPLTFQRGWYKSGPRGRDEEKVRHV